MRKSNRLTQVVLGVALLSLVSGCAFARVFHLGRLRGNPPGQQMQTAGVDASGVGLTAYQVNAGGVSRTYYLHVPANLPSGKVPLVMAFHGGGGEAVNFASKTGLVEAADKYGFILAVPEGTQKSWNAGGATPVGYAERAGVDDVGFVNAMLDQIEAQYPINTGEVHATGMSNGGMFVYRLACDMPQRLKSIAVVAATLDEPVCQGAQNISLLHIHGTADQNVPMAGGRGTLSARRANYPPVVPGIELFKARNQCTAAPTQSQPAQDTVCSTSSCGDGATVEFCQVQNGGHAWPGIPPENWQVQNNVYVSPYFHATDAIAMFFQQH
jgi:polyhydroxybutyrate depolymerase